MDEEGVVYVFEGDGKGKTSAALGTALRMLLLEKKVVWISWFKTSKWQIAETKLPLYFGKNLRMHWAGEGFYIKSGIPEKKGTKIVRTARSNGALVFDVATPTTHQQAAKKALKLATEALAKKHSPELLVLDEIIQAVNEGLLTEMEVLSLISKRGRTHLILTGHVCPGAIAEKADLVTDMRKIKHPYDKGMLAIRGLDF